MPRILVTGANGHLGANIVRNLLKRGYEVVPFVRRSSDTRGLDGLGLHYVYGDVMDRDTLVAAAEGCDVLMHTATVFRLWKKNPEEILQPALVGTRNALTAAKEAGVKRLVYTSSTFAVGSSDTPQKLRTSSDWNDDARNPYVIAKIRAEKVAWRLAEELGVSMISICPGGFFGAYDFRMTPSSTLMRDLVNGTMPTLHIGVDFVDVRDVAEIHVRAVVGGEIGKRYLVAGEKMLMYDLGQIIRQITGFRPRHVEMGRTLMSFIAGMAELSAKLTNSEPFLTRGFVHEVVGRYAYFDCQETWRTFGFKPRTMEEMVADAIRWLLYIGEIKPALAVRLADQFPPDPEWSTDKSPRRERLSAPSVQVATLQRP